MRLDFSELPLRDKAFSEKPMTFIDPAPKTALAAIIEIIAVETGNRAVREYWQQKQLENLLGHATKRSAFWRQRIGKISDVSLSQLPVLTRDEVEKQVATEGPLLSANDRIRIAKHSSSGSSGKPVQFFVSEMNATYSDMRWAAQYFIEGKDLTLNHTRLRPAPLVSATNGFTVDKSGMALGTLGSLVRCGNRKYIEYSHPDIKSLCAELEAEPIGYLVAHPEMIEIMLQYVEPDFFKRAGTAMLRPMANAAGPELRKLFSSVAIPVRGTYTSEEIGPIGSECEHVPECYHLATSNVIVEVVPDDAIHLKDQIIGRVLVTHLHSYATPFIRYDLGDVATMRNSCACGHDGPVLSNIYGRSKSLLKHADGHVTTFFVRGKELAAIGEFDECRIRQTSIRNIVVEIGGRSTLTAEEVASFRELIRAHAGEDFEIDIKPVARIDWGKSTKKLGFHNEIL